MRKNEISVDTLATIATGNRLQSLQMLRDRLAEELDAGPSSRDVAPLVKQITEVMAEIEKLSPTKEASEFDDLASRRAARRANASSTQPAEGQTQ